MASCPTCRAQLETPLACGACGALLAPEQEPTPFAVLGLEPSFELDAQELRRRVKRLGRLVHPDFFGTREPEVRALAERNSARLNDAHEALREPARRADWIVRHLGGPDENEERQMPQAFLMEVLEWNETLEEARAGGPAAGLAQLEALREDLVARRAEGLGELRALLVPLPAPAAPALAQARRLLNALRYFDRTLLELEALRLERAASE